MGFQLIFVWNQRGDDRGHMPHTGGVPADEFIDLEISGPGDSFFAVSEFLDILRPRVLGGT